MSKELATMEESNKYHNIPAGWILVKLKDILGFVKGKKPKNLGPRTEIRKQIYINIEAFENKIFALYTNENDPLCEETDVLIVWDGARCGLVGRGVSGVIGSTLAKLRHYEIDSSYLFYFLQSKFEEINKRPRGVGIPHVEPNLFWNINFPLPPLAEQHRIVYKFGELLSRVEYSIDILKKLKLQLKLYEQSVIENGVEGKLTKEWRESNKNETILNSVIIDDNSNASFEQLPILDIPQNWQFRKISELLESKLQGFYYNKEYFSDGIPLLRISDMGRYGNIVYDNIPKIHASPRDVVRYELKKEDLVMARTGATRGKMCIFDKDNYKIMFAGYLIRFRFKNIINPYFVRFCFEHRKIKKQLLSTSHGIATQNINAENVKMISIPCPSLVEQNEIVKRINHLLFIVYNIQNIIQKSVDHTKRLHQSILQAAFEGKLVPQDQNDEPVSELLKRIKQEKSKLEEQRSIKAKTAKQRKRSIK